MACFNWPDPYLNSTVLFDILNTLHSYFRASTNCDLFTLDKPDFDICLKFRQDLSTKIFQFVTTRYHAALQKHDQISLATINDQSKPSTSVTASKSDIKMEAIELGTLDDSTQRPMTTVKSRLIWKYMWLFTISHKSIFAKTLNAVSLLLNTTLSFTIPYQVMNLNINFVSICLYSALLYLQVFYNEQHVVLMVIYIISELFYSVEVLPSIMFITSV